MATWTRPPHEALRPIVTGYVGYRDRLDPRLVHHGLPSPTLTVIWALDEPLDTGWLGAGASDRYWAMAGGLHVKPALVRPHGFQCGLQLNLTPRGCRALFGVPAAALAGTLVHLGELSDEIGRRGHERLADASGWQERFDILDELLLRALGDGRADADADVEQAWQLIEAGRGRRRIGAIARHLGRSERWLSKRFASEYGVTPQQAGRLHRFATGVAHARGGAALADVAASTGYADQPHLTRDWRELAGMTPTELLRSPYRFVQDAELDLAAG